MKRYAVHPDHMESKSDGQIHYIGASQLMRLYGVNPQECVVIDHKRPNTYLGLDMEKLIHLRPRYDGNYQLPKETR